MYCYVLGKLITCVNCHMVFGLIEKLALEMGWGALSCLTSQGAWDGRDLDTACCEALFSGVRAMYGVTGPTGQRLLVMGIPGLGDSSYDYKGT